MKTIRENVIDATIFTDEEMELPVEIYYQSWSRLLADTLIDNVYAEVKGNTVTPDYIIQDQVRDAIQANHANRIQLHTKINIAFI